VTVRLSVVAECVKLNVPDVFVLMMLPFYTIEKSVVGIETLLELTICIAHPLKLTMLIVTNVSKDVMADTLTVKATG